MNYWKLKQLLDETELRRAVPRLRALRRQLKSEVPAKDADENLLLATWNLRDFGDPGGGYGHGERLPESLFYIAEILSRFDFVAVQEVNELGPWEEVMSILGPHYAFIASDVTEGTSGNGERLTYLYDRRKVSFRDIAGEIVLQPSQLISKTAKGGRQFARTPYFASFQAGWRKFDICTAHIYYGEASGEKFKRRVGEIRAIVKILAKRAEAASAAGKAMILLGDFNVVGPEDETMKALQREGFVVPEAIELPPLGERNSFYDQIAFKAKEGVLEMPKGRRVAGSVPIYENVFTLEQIDDYRERFEDALAALNEEERQKAKAKRKEPQLTTPEEYFERWRTWELSDHQPLWVRLKANDSDKYLRGLLAKK